MHSIAKNWDRVHSWLAIHAPKILASLNPGATDEELDAAEAELGLAIPSAMRDLYRIHDGISLDENFGSLFYGIEFLDLSQVVSTYSDRAASSQTMKDEGLSLIKAADTGIQDQDMFNLGWIPFACDGADVLLHVDTRPDTSGTVGQVIFSDYDYDVVGLVAQGIDTLLNQFADDLENGRYYLDADALKDGNEYLDCEKEIDIVNWSQTSRWKHLDK